MNIPAALKALEPDMLQWRHFLHQHPELQFDVHTTADFIAQKLESFGLEVTRQVGRTGLVASLRKGTGDAAIALRADMDALPIIEANDFAHKSTHQGQMHACGHDGHSTMLLGAAAFLTQHVDFSGTVHFVFQPAEEGDNGAKAMVDDGLFERFPAARIFAIHNWPGLPAGHFGIMPGTIMASADNFDITIHAQGGHAGMPGTCNDPFLALAQLIPAVHAIPSRRFNPSEAPVISITQVAGGSAHNVVPDTIRIAGTVRALNPAIQKKCHQALQDLATGIGQATGARIDLDYDYITPATINTSAEADMALAAATRVVGTERVHTDLPPSMGAEDFSEMLKVRPGAYVWLGNGEDSASLHNPNYDFNDSIALAGAAYYVELVRQQLVD